MLMRGWKFDSIRNGLSPFAMSHFEIGSDKRISRHLSGRNRPSPSAKPSFRLRDLPGLEPVCAIKKGRR